MKIKRFFATDMRQAIRLVREEQGPDAVILSNRKVDGGVEIVSAVDYDEALIDKALRKDEAAALSRPVGVAGTAASPPAQPAAAAATAQPASGKARDRISWAQDPALVAMKDEIRELRGLLEHQLAHLAWGDMNHNRPQQLEVLRRFHALGMKPSMALHLAERVSHCADPEQAWRAALGLFAQAIPVTNDDILERGGMVALLGATGVGKTTTVAKLAARFALRHGQKRVALVTTDGYRIGAHEQLLTYGKILGVPVQVASDHDQLAQVLKSVMDKHLVLIDTAGMSQRDLRLTEQFGTLANTGLPIRSYLVLAATAQAAVQEETIRAFRGVELDGCILTKVDETASLGGALSVIAEQQLPLAYVADGQRVPEDMQPARPHNLVQQAAGMLQEADWIPGDAVLAERFGGVMANAHV